MPILERFRRYPRANTPSIRGGCPLITSYIGKISVAIRAYMGLRRNVLIAFYTAFPRGFVMGFVRSVGRAILQVYSAHADTAGRRLGRSDVIQYYFFR